MLCSLAAGWLAAPVGAAAGDLVASDPYVVIAGFLHAFPSYVEWPTNVPATNPPPWRLGVVGDDPFGDSLADIFDNHPVRGRQFEIIHAARAEDLPPCDIVYIGSKDIKQVKQSLAMLAARPVLTVSEADDFLELGGIVELHQGPTVRFSIDLDNARAAGLKIPAGMLEVAAKVVENGRTIKKE